MILTKDESGLEMESLLFAVGGAGQFLTLFSFQRDPKASLIASNATSKKAHALDAMQAEDADHGDGDGSDEKNSGSQNNPTGYSVKMVARIKLPFFGVSCLEWSTWHSSSDSKHNGSVFVADQKGGLLQLTFEFGVSDGSLSTKIVSNKKVTLRHVPSRRVMTLPLFSSLLNGMISKCRCFVLIPTTRNLSLSPRTASSSSLTCAPSPPPSPHYTPIISISLRSGIY